MVKKILFTCACSLFLFQTCFAQVEFSYCPAEFKSDESYSGWLVMQRIQPIEQALPLVEVVALENIASPVSCAYRSSDTPPLEIAMLITLGATIRIDGKLIDHWASGKIGSGYRCYPQNGDPMYCPFIRQISNSTT